MAKKKKKLKELKIPMKFNLGTLKFEPQLEKLNKDEIEDIKKWKKKKSSKQEK